jgi:hypothetical protein
VGAAKRLIGDDSNALVVVIKSMLATSRLSASPQE